MVKGSDEEVRLQETHPGKSLVAKGSLTDPWWYFTHGSNTQDSAILPGHLITR